MANKPKIITIVGPTASGKTSLSIEVSERVGGEVISADSRQVYSGLDIGTGKVTPEEMRNVPHHLIDVADPSEVFTAADFLKQADKAVADIHGRGNLPIVAGGTFFYVDLLRGKMSAAPVEPDGDFRDSLEKYSDTELLELLEQKDPRRANNIDQQNRRRLVRALEIVHTLGSVPETQLTESPYDWLILGIDIQKTDLRDKFSKRLESWLKQGLLAEVENIRLQVSPERFAEFGFEYLLTSDYLDKKISKDELFEKFVQKNWQYAKRQMTWLKRDQEIKWISATGRIAAFELVDDFLNK